MEYLDVIQWDDPAVFGPLLAAVTAGIFAIVIAIIKYSKPSSPAVVLMPREKDVGPAVIKAVEPLREEMKSMREQLAQLAPIQTVPPPDPENPMKVWAVKFYNAGRDAYEKGEIGQALGHWLDARQLDPDYANAPNAIGVALAAKSDHDAAIEQYKTALQIDPDFAKAHYNFGNALRAQGKLDAAIEQYNAARRIDPNYAYARNGLGVVMHSKGDFDAAIEHYNDALRINPKIALYHDNLAMALAQKKDAARAVSALAKAIEIDTRYRAWAKTDADYDPIRDDPAFRKLVYGE